MRLDSIENLIFLHIQFSKSVQMRSVSPSGERRLFHSPTRMSTSFVNVFSNLILDVFEEVKGSWWS